VRIVAVVVNWNGGEENLECVDALSAPDGGVARVVFVDNASTNPAWKRVVERFPAIEVIESRENLGYGGGNNLGIARALELDADAVLIVNNDVVVQRGTVAALARALEGDRELGIVGPRVLFKARPELVWAAGGMLTWRQNLTTLRGHLQTDGPEWQREVDVDYVAGCAMLVRREVFERAGELDAAYFAYTEDVDFGLRAKRAGFRSRCIGTVAALHAPSSATGGGYNPRRKYMMGVNSVWFLRRWANAGNWMSFVVFDVLTLPLVWLVGVMRGRGKAVAAKALGIFDGLRGRRITADTVRSGSSWLW
jgi:GT2 family glycosyltransferase